MKLSIIVAQSNNSVIGINNELPWSLPKDLKYFRTVTAGKPIIMGRKTFDSIGRPLPDRANIVISTNQELVIAGVDVVDSLASAVKRAEQVCEESNTAEVMVIGGSQIYQQALPDADRLYITEVDADVEGDAFFPEVNYDLYKKTVHEEHLADKKNQYDYRFVVYDKVIK